jgi:hypothetical protein
MDYLARYHAPLPSLRQQNSLLGSLQIGQSSEIPHDRSIYPVTYRSIMTGETYNKHSEPQCHGLGCFSS